MTNKGIRSASICIELRDTGEPYGFLLPADQVRETVVYSRMIVGL